jgi:hypothetical protein
MSKASLILVKFHIIIKISYSSFTQKSLIIFGLPIKNFQAFQNGIKNFSHFSSSFLSYPVSTHLLIQPSFISHYLLKAPLLSQPHSFVLFCFECPSLGSVQILPSTPPGF